MKSVSKFITFLVLSVFAAETALASSVYIPPSKTKPDISRLKADPGCKYIVEYNEFVAEYSVNHICDVWQAYTLPKQLNTYTTTKAPVAQPVVQPVVVPVQAPTYPVYVNNVSNNYSVPTWGFTMPSFSNWFSGFSSWFYEPVAYDIDVIEPVYEIEEYSWYEPVEIVSYDPGFDFEYNNYQDPGFDFNYNDYEDPGFDFNYNDYKDPGFDFNFNNYSDPGFDFNFDF
jgi:hypothetical protein